MKHIKKSISPPKFETWKSEKPTNWTPDWNKFKHPLKGTVLKSLLEEQGHICCYCGQEIDKKSSHIEHINPKSKNKNLMFDYGNLLCSCQPDSFVPKQPRHCGHQKGNWYSLASFVSPLMANCEKRFSFNALGEIYATNANDSAAKKTIQVLALNIACLTAQRKSLIETFLDLTEEELKIIINKYSAHRSKDKFYPFCFVVTNFFSNYVRN